MGAMQPQSSADGLLEQLAKAVLTTDIGGLLVCPLPGCSMVVGYAVSDLVDHVWARHREMVLGGAALLTLVLLSARRRGA